MLGWWDRAALFMGPVHNDLQTRVSRGRLNISSQCDRYPVLLFTCCSMDQQTSVSSSTPTHHPAKPWTGIPVLNHASLFLPLPFILHSEVRKSLYRSVWPFHSQVHHLRAHTTNSVLPWPTAPMSWPCPYLHLKCSPLSLPLLPQGQRPMPTRAPGPFYLLVSTGMVVSDICPTIEPWYVPTACKSNCTPYSPPPLSAPHLSSDMSHRVSILHWKVPEGGTFCCIRLSSKLEQGFPDNRCSFK